MYPDLRVSQADAYKLLFEIQAAIPTGNFTIDRSPLGTGGDPDIFEINGMPVAQLRYIQAQGPGGWAQVSNGYPTWVRTATVPQSQPHDSSGSGAIPQQGTGVDVFGGKINASTNSTADLASAAQKALADLLSDLRAKGVI